MLTKITNSGPVAVKTNFNFLNCLFAVCLVAVCGAFFSQPVSAQEWLFKRSYYSHNIPQEMENAYPRPTSRSAYRRAYANNRPGFAVRGGYRYNTIRIWSGTSYDTTVIRENWFEERP